MVRGLAILWQWISGCLLTVVAAYSARIFVQDGINASLSRAIVDDQHASPVLGPRKGCSLVGVKMYDAATRTVRPVLDLDGDKSLSYRSHKLGKRPR